MIHLGVQRVYASWQRAQLARFLGVVTDFSVIASVAVMASVREDLERMAQRGVTVDEAMSTVRFAIGGDNVVGIRQPDKTIVPLAIQYAPSTSTPWRRCGIHLS